MTTTHPEPEIQIEEDFDPFQRDGYGRPLILDPTTGRVTPYTRISTFAGTITSKHLTEYDGWWGMRAYHLHPEQARVIASAPDQKGQKAALNELLALAGKYEKRDRGSARHARVRQYLTNSPSLPPLSDEQRIQLDAVAGLVHSLGRLDHVELPLVNDEWKVAGSADYVGTCPDGRPYVADLKTGDSRFGNSTDIEWGLQLIAYARSLRWEPSTQSRGEPICVDPPRLYIVHAPQSHPDILRIYEYDIPRCKQLGDIAAQVVAARSGIKPLMVMEHSA